MVFYDSPLPYDNLLTYDGGEVVTPGPLSPVAVVPHLAVPFSIGPSGSAAVVQQDTLDEVAQCVSVILGTLVGQRTAVPTFGIVDPTFTSPNPAEITGAIAVFEPRAKAAVTVTDLSGSQAQVHVAVSLAQPAS